MVWQIPYSVDELVATYQFLRRRHRAGQPWLLVSPVVIIGTSRQPPSVLPSSFTTPAGPR